MKSLIIKDLLNIVHNLKSLFLMLIVFAFAFIPSSGPSTYIILSALLCGMMMITTYAFDERSNWEKYALTLPIKRQDVIKSKFIVLYLFAVSGAIWGTLVSYIGQVILTKQLLSLEEVMTLLTTALIAIIIATFGASITIPVIVKKGAEKARLLSFIAFLIPAGIIFLLIQIGKALKIPSDSTTASVVVVITCLLALAIQIIPYKLASKLYQNKSLI